MNSAPKPHSEEQFGPQRDFWWNRDFLALMARRWRLAEASSLADIGCGLCHWSRLLYGYLRPPARFAGVDREARWVAEGGGQFAAAFPGVPGHLLSFLQGDASRVPLPDDAFEVVTCQTVLMHLPDPSAGLREMWRIARPGGLVICAEPGNLWNYLPFTSLTPDEPTGSLVGQFEFWLRCHRGRIALGEGDHNLGDRLPGLFAELGFADIAVYQSDRVPTLFPPYGTPAQQAIVQEAGEQASAGRGPSEREALRRLFLAGGGAGEAFESMYEAVVAGRLQQARGIADGTFHAGFGGITYLVSGRKPGH